MLRVTTEDDGVVGIKQYNIDKLGLADADPHKAIVIIDASGRLQVFLDDGLVFKDRETDQVMTNPEGGANGGWVLGTLFDSQISDFRIDDDISPLLRQQPVTSDATAFV